MIKKFKIYEDYFGGMANSRTKITEYEYNIDEYVKVVGIIKTLKDSFFRIKERYRNFAETKYINSYYLKDIIYSKNLPFWVYESNLRKLTKEEKDELEIIIASKKYNI